MFSFSVDFSTCKIGSEFSSPFARCARCATRKTKSRELHTFISKWSYNFRTESESRRCVSVARDSNFTLKIKVCFRFSHEFCWMNSTRENKVEITKKLTKKLSYLHSWALNPSQLPQLSHSWPSTCSSMIGLWNEMVKKKSAERNMRNHSNWRMRSILIKTIKY